jgi:hypothetical protein
MDMRSYRRPIWSNLQFFPAALHNPLIGSIAPVLAVPCILVRVERLATGRSAARAQRYNCRCEFHHAVLNVTRASAGNHALSSATYSMIDDYSEGRGWPVLCASRRV